MNLFRKALLILLLIVCLVSPCLAQSAENTIIVKSSVTKAANTIVVNYEIRNLSGETAYHLAVTSYLARKTNRSASLGDVPSGKHAGHKSYFDAADLLPGSYILASRIDFGDAQGQVRRVYHFSAIQWKEEGKGKEADLLNATLNEPFFNRKSFWHPRGKFELSLKNNLPQPLEPVLIFFLPDGFNVVEPEKVYPMQPDEKKVIKIPLSFDASVAVGSGYSALVWYEAQGVHYSRLIQGKIHVEDKPVYFKIYLAAVSAFAAFSLLIYLIRRRRS